LYGLAGYQRILGSEVAGELTDSPARAGIVGVHIAPEASSADHEGHVNYLGQPFTILTRHCDGMGRDSDAGVSVAADSSHRHTVGTDAIDHLTYGLRKDGRRGSHLDAR
jgi:hypothetical protein